MSSPLADSPSEYASPADPPTSADEPSRVALVWTDFGENAGAADWYATSFIPNNAVRLGTQARLAETLEENIFKEIPEIEGKYMATYDIPATISAEELDGIICPAPYELPSAARLDTRCYKEYATWYGGAWREEVRDTRLWVVILWQPHDAYHDEFVDFFREDFAPGMLESADLLRIQIFKLEYASRWENQKHQRMDIGQMYQYITIWEFSSNELPWEILVYLGASEEWRYHVEGQHLVSLREYAVAQPPRLT
ncbi:hypothetical protein P153DRAFT_303659 [Dothidotthia symphoricarpi CBS 119687]|uniref:Uncharacterized protein n=1 Tax=Dothidotthia symphoricarpi CBS 119687 TaxID=1392245 RepID=A0A6A5ZXC7_9PLEO|nr:uncharacterized protein P153DRAFT_303659 [Dothidotthia symphoricarpi CBS 119687]KAF2123553.1 hypothetical protein P153DRAFT_303659 [Dothidotthia symphoricarpi CBS 119687]